MADNFLIEEKIIRVRKEFLHTVGVVGAIDRGCTLTKILFGTEYDTDHYRLHFALFKNSHFEQGLEYLKQKGMVIQKDGAALHVTGAGCDMHRDVIRDKLGLEIEFIDEFLTQSRGTHWMIAFTESDLLYPEPQLDVSQIETLRENNFIKVFVEMWKRDIGEQDPNAKFPCLVLFIGSGAGILKVQEDGTSEMVGGVWMAGRTFLGMAKQLLGTCDYDEIMQLAAAGDRARVDTQAKDVLANDENSPYGKFPPEMPIFSFGKLADESAPQPSREDLAHSLVFSFAQNAFMCLSLVAKTTKIGRMYMAGNFFRGELVRKQIAMQIAMYGGDDVMKIRFVQTGHTGAVGAMLSNAEDAKKYMAAMAAMASQKQDTK